jgi:hypothetical protein
MDNRFAKGLSKISALPGAPGPAEVKLAPASEEEPRVQASFRLPRSARDAGIIKARQEGADLQKVLTRLYYEWLNG